MEETYQTGLVMLLSLLGLAGSACDVSVKPLPPSPACTAVASGRIVHLYPAEDWRTDGAGARSLGEAFALDSSLTVKKVVEDTAALSLGCLGFQLYSPGQGVPEARIAVVGIESSKGQPSPPAAQPSSAPPYTYGATRAATTALYQPATQDPGFTKAMYTPLAQLGSPGDAYPEELSAGPVYQPPPATYGGASITIRARFGFFWPAGVQVIDRELTAYAQGPIPPAESDGATAKEAYARALDAMVSTALQQLADQIVLAFADQDNLIASLPSAPVPPPASYVYPTQPATQPGVYAYQPEPPPSTAPPASSAPSEQGKAGKKKKGSKAGAVLGGLLGGGKKSKGSKGSGSSQPAASAEPAYGTTSPSSPVAPSAPSAPVSDAQAKLNAEYLRAMHDEEFPAAREAIKEGADPLCILTDKQGYNELHAAAVKGDVAMAKGVLAAGKVDVNSGTKDGVLPLHIASALGDLPMVKYLVGQGASPAYTDMDASYPAPNWAAMEGQLAVVKYFIEQVKLDVDLDLPPGVPTPLIAAALTGQMPVVKYLLTKKADINHEGMWNETALHGAAQNNHAEMCKFLLQKGANVNAISEELETPLHNAARFCPDDESCVATVKVLMEKGADKYAEDDDGNTAMDYAKENGDDEILKYLASH